MMPRKITHATRTLLDSITALGAVLILSSSLHVHAQSSDPAKDYNDQLDAMQASNEGYVDAVVTPMLEKLVRSSFFLEGASAAFEESPGIETLMQFRQQLVETELLRSAASVFDFGPIHSRGFATAMDTRADIGALQQILSPNSTDTAREMAAKNHPWMQGFDAMNHLLNGNDKNIRNLEEITDTERYYLRLLATQLRETTQQLRDSWTREIDGYPAFRTILSTAGELTNPFYLTVNSASEEILRGVVNALGVVANESLPSLNDADASIDINRFGDTLAQSRAVLVGAAAAYAGQSIGLNTRNIELGTSATGGSSGWVGHIDAALDDTLRLQLTMAIADITELAGAFAQYDPQTREEKLANVQSSISQVLAMLESEVLPLTQSSLPAN